MNKTVFEKHIIKVLNLKQAEKKEINSLQIGLDKKGKQRDILDGFLDNIKLQKNKETRFLAYSRIVHFNETDLKTTLGKGNLKEEDISTYLDKSYIFVKKYYEDIQEKIIKKIESSKLLTPFYRELMIGVHNVGKTFSNFFLVWNNHIINSINKELEEKFNNDTELVMNYLSDNSLLDLGHNGTLADRSYSVLEKKGKSYISKSYYSFFKKEVLDITKQLDIFIEKLSKLEDDIYLEKDNYLNYLKSIKEAFLEKDVNKLVEKWAMVDENWMNISSPFQITHPLEYYACKYRKTVSPEWDLRILDNSILKSEVYSDILKMFEGFYDNIGNNSYEQTYNFTKENLRKIQLYISSQVLCYGSSLSSAYSAQVVPNDEEVSSKYGKKIFAFPWSVLDTKRETPFMELQSKTIEKRILDKYRKFLFGEDEIFYRVYDIETIGHEIGHILWQDIDTEILMNKKTGMYKNIEEFKATSGGLISYFIKDDLTLRNELILNHLMRCVGLLKYKNIIEITPYYCESLIHLDILLSSGIAYIKKNKVYTYINEKNYKSMREKYIEAYSKLIYIYLEKKDASVFLFDYVSYEDGDYIPVNKELASFVENYYELYKDIGNHIDEDIKKEDYTSKEPVDIFTKITDKILK